jgi:hypothetical protein
MKVELMSGETFKVGDFVEISGTVLAGWIDAVRHDKKGRQEVLCCGRWVLSGLVHRAPSPEEIKAAMYRSLPPIGETVELIRDWEWWLRCLGVGDVVDAAARRAGWLMRPDSEYLQLIVDQFSNSVERYLVTQGVAVHWCCHAQPFDVLARWPALGDTLAKVVVRQCRSVMQWAQQRRAFEEDEQDDDGDEDYFPE